MVLLSEIRRLPRLTAAHAATLVQKPEEDARGVLEQLAEAGLLDRRGQRSARTYRLSAETSRRLGKPEAVGTRGSEPVEQEQMVLRYIEEHGAITRSQAAGLCHLTSPQARYLLSRLVKKGLLSRQGVRRGTRYALTTKNMDKSIGRLDKSNRSARGPRRGVSTS